MFFALMQLVLDSLLVVTIRQHDVYRSRQGTHAYHDPFYAGFCFRTDDQDMFRCCSHKDSQKGILPYLACLFLLLLMMHCVKCLIVVSFRSSSLISEDGLHNLEQPSPRRVTTSLQGVTEAFYFRPSLSEEAFSCSSSENSPNFLRPRQDLTVVADHWKQFFCFLMPVRLYISAGSEKWREIWPRDSESK